MHTHTHTHITCTLSHGLCHPLFQASVNEVTMKNHSSPLYIAAQNGHLEIIHILASSKVRSSLWLVVGLLVVASKPSVLCVWC